MTKRLSSFLNASRWIAALLVAISHARHLILVDSADLASRSMFNKVFYFVTGLGHEAVIVFFVVSGYLVGGNTVIRYKRHGFNLLDYTLHRTSRIYTVLIPALLIGWLLDSTGLHFFNLSQLYTASAQYKTASMDFAIRDNLNPSVFIGNLAMMETILCPRLGSNGPLWSLVFEWWYYSMFGAIMVAAVSQRLIVRILGGFALLAMGTLLPSNLVIWSLLWFVGLAAALYGQSNFWKPSEWLGLVLLAAAITISRISTHYSDNGDLGYSPEAFARDLTMALGFTAALLAFHREGKAVPFAETHERLAGFSYSLYLVHFPMLVFVVAALHDLLGYKFLYQPSIASVVYLGGVLLLLVSYAFVFSLFTEARTSSVRKFLVGALRLGRQPALSTSE